MNGVIVKCLPPTAPMSQREAEDWASWHLPQRTPERGLCVGILRGEVFGPYRTPAEAAAALDRRLAELAVQGEPLREGDDAGSIAFVDAAHHVPATDEGSLNG
jgi:hypothetical protein